MKLDVGCIFILNFLFINLQCIKGMYIKYLYNNTQISKVKKKKGEYKGKEERNVEKRIFVFFLFAKKKKKK